jgi:hypothetical protein
MKTGNESKRRTMRIVEIVTLEGATFTGEICGNNSKGLFLREEGITNPDNLIFISHQAISHIKVIGWSKQKNT